jgi:hypothetical protein
VAATPPIGALGASDNLNRGSFKQPSSAVTRAGDVNVQHGDLAEPEHRKEPR